MKRPVSHFPKPLLRWYYCWQREHGSRFWMVLPIIFLTFVRSAFRVFPLATAFLCVPAIGAVFDAKGGSSTLADLEKPQYYSKITKSSGGSWLSYEMDTSGSGSYNSFIANVSENTGAKARRGSFTVSQWFTGSFYLAYDPPLKFQIAQAGTDGTITTDVTLDKGIGNGGTSEIVATYQMAMPDVEIPSHGGYSFEGYYTSTGGGGTRYYTSTGSSARNWDFPYDETKTLYANWKANTYLVKLNACGGSGGTSEVEMTYDAGAPSISPPSWSGYQFTGYFQLQEGKGTQYYRANGTSVRKWLSTTIVELYACWTGNVYHVELDMDGGDWGTESVDMTFGSTLPDIVPPSRPNYLFAGYFDGSAGSGTCYYDETGKGVRNWDKLAGGTLHAKWSPVPDPECLVVSFITNGGSSCSDQEYTIGETYGALPTTTKKGYAFNGWYTSSSFTTKVTASSTVSSSVTTLYAKWTPITYTIEYNYDGGTKGENNPSSRAYDSTFYVSAPTRSGHTFTGWTVTSGLDSSTAKWGTSSSPSTTISSSSMKCVNGASGNVYFKNLRSTSGSVTLKAIWTANTISVSFNTNDGSSCPPQNYTVGSTYGSLPTTTKKGYAFNGWYTSSSFTTKVTASSTVSSSVTTLYAKWTPITYTVLYDYAGGTKGANNPASGTYDTAFRVSAPTRNGSTFTGWTVSSGLDASTAKWGMSTSPSTAISSSSTLCANGASGDMYFKNLRSTDGSITLTANWDPVGWTYTIENGTATITGSDNPIGDLVIPSSIGGCPVVAIGDGAFEGCNAITSVTIGNGVTNIGIRAFCDCSGLASITIPNGVTNIGQDAFAYCRSLTHITIPSSVTCIGVWAFWRSGLRSIVVDDANAIYDSRDNCNAIIRTSDNTLIVGCNNSFIPNSVTRIGDHALSGCTDLTAVAIPNSVTSIGNDAFAFCDSLTSMTIPESVMTFGGGSFSSCSNLSTLYLPYRFEGNTGSMGIPSSCSVIYYGSTYAIAYKPGSSSTGAQQTDTKKHDVALTLKDAIFTRTGYTQTGWATSDGGSKVYDLSDSYTSNSALTLYPFWTPMPVDETMWNYRIEYGEATVTGTAYTTGDLVIPPVLGGCPVTHIDWDAFSDKTGLTSVTIPDSVTKIDDGAFSGCSGLLSVKMPINLTWIGDSAFSNCKNLTSMTIPGKVTHIGWWAFSGCSGLLSIKIPASVESLSEYTFLYCSGLQSIQVDTGNTTFDSRNDCNAIIRTGDNTLVLGCKNTVIPNSVTSVGYLAFSGCTGLTSIAIPDSVTRIGGHAFSGCTGLTSVTIPASVTDIGGGAFSDCGGIESIVVDDNNDYYDSRDNCNAIVRTADNLLVAGCQNTTIPRGVTSIGYGAFRGFTGLASIAIPNSVTNIGYDAFSGCSGLTSITIPDSVTSIESSAFSDCTGLSSVTIPAGVTSIGHSAFSGCTELTSVTIPDGVTYIGDYAFSGCSGLTSILIPNSVLYIGRETTPGFASPSYAFDCSSLNTLYLPRRFESEVPSLIYIPSGCTVVFYDHTVTFNANGGTGADMAQGFPTGVAQELERCPFARAGHRFLGWSEDPDALTPTYTDGATFTAAGDVTLYAVWDEHDWTVAGCLDAPELSFEAKGGVAWEADWSEFKSGAASLRSGALPAAERGTTTNTTLRTTVFGAGTLSFWWKVDCEDMDEEYDEWYDYGSFSVDGGQFARFAGASGWRKVECVVAGEGNHTLEWSFVRDDYDEEDADWANALWLDGVQWTPAPVTLTFAGGGATAGEVPTAVVGHSGYELVLPGPGTLANPPFAFMGWSDGSATYAPGETYVFGTEDAVLTAVWELKIWTLAEAVDAPALVFTTGGITNWTVDVSTGCTNGVSARSGAVESGEASWMETTVSGAGTLTFRWKVLGGIYRNNPFAYTKVEVDGENAAQTHLTDGWAEVRLAVEGAGSHTVRWTYLRTSARTADGDCAWLDVVSWVPATADAVVVEGVSVPVSWIEDAAAPLLAAAGGNPAAAANATAANGVNTVWECYVAGISPTNAAARFEATIAIGADGKPDVKWTPELTAEERSKRTYRTLGKKTLDPGEDWTDVTDVPDLDAAGYRFFKASVEMR